MPRGDNLAIKTLLEKCLHTKSLRFSSELTKCDFSITLSHALFVISFSAIEQQTKRKFFLISHGWCNCLKNCKHFFTLFSLKIRFDSFFSLFNKFTDDSERRKVLIRLAFTLQTTRWALGDIGVEWVELKAFKDWKRHKCYLSLKVSFLYVFIYSWFVTQQESSMSLITAAC